MIIREVFYILTEACSHKVTSIQNFKEITISMQSRE